MNSQSPSASLIDDAMLQALISGWAKSRGGNDVSVTHQPGCSHCVFKLPIGVRSRDRESFYWHDGDNIASVRKFHKGKHHYLSILSTDALPEPQLTQAGYQFCLQELLMYRAIGTESYTTTIPVQRVQTAEEAEWYNRQRGFNVIRAEHLTDARMYDFYTRHHAQMSSYARAIHQDDWFIVDDVLTYPDHRRKGLASALIHTIAAAAQRAGAKGMILIASQTGIPLYEREKFSAVIPLRVYNASH